MTNWAAGYEILIDKRLDLDIADHYLTQLGLTAGLDATGAAAGVTNGNAADYYNDGYTQRYSDTTNNTGVLQLYNTASSDSTSADGDYTTATTNYSDRAVLIASANSDYLLADALWEQN